MAGHSFLVEEYLAGGTLAHMLSMSRPPLIDALRLGVTLAEVLEQLHTAGIMHCDVKPGNIGFTQTGVVKLLDFGLARLLRDSRGPSDMSTTDAGNYVPRPVAASASGVVAGTPYYMSPEAVRGERPTPAFDVWALSVVVYEVIAGRRPFEGHDSHRIFERILSDARPDLRWCIRSVRRIARRSTSAALIGGEALDAGCAGVDGIAGAAWMS